MDQGAGDDEEVGELEPAPAVPTLLAPGIPPFKAVEEYARISEVPPRTAPTRCSIRTILASGHQLEGATHQALVRLSAVHSRE